MRYSMPGLTVLFVTCGWVTTSAGAESHLMRMADVHEGQVVFTYHNGVAGWGKR